MYARFVKFTLGAGRRAVAQALADDLVPRIASQPGCASVTVYGDDGAGEYGIFVLWESEGNAAGAASVIRPILDKHLSGNAKAPPEVRLFEVISRAGGNQ
jgi:hypothetical protein